VSLRNLKVLIAVSVIERVVWIKVRIDPKSIGASSRLHDVPHIPCLNDASPASSSRSPLCLSDPFSDPFYKYRSAFFLSDMGLTDEAYVIISNLHKIDPKNPNYMQGLASFEELRKNIPNAISIRNEISKGDPWNAANYLKLLVLYKDSGDLVNASAMKDKILSFASNTEIAKTASEILG
jgi:tetratricopeptide (TPR) repeat protein